jgi:hypothetical protein
MKVSMPTGSGVALLCIVSRDPLPSGVFVAALATAVGPRDELEIIVDRRRGGPPTDQPSIERRHRPHVTRALERDGFAIVPTHATQPAQHSIPAASPIERLALQAADERELKRILEFKRRQRVRLSQWLILTGLMSVILVLLVLSPAVKTLMSRIRPVALPAADRTNASPIVEEAPRVVETPKPKPDPADAETPSPNPEAPAVRPAPTVAVPPAPERAPVSASPTSSAPTIETRPAPAVRPSTPALAPPAVSAPEQPLNDADDPRAVIDWLLNPSSWRSPEPDQRSMPRAPR